MSLNLREQLYTEMKLFHPYKIVIVAGCGGMWQDAAGQLYIAAGQLYIVVG